MLIYKILTFLALAAGLALPTAFPEVANVLFLVVAGLSLPLCARDTDWRELLAHPGVMAPLGAVALLLVAFTGTASTPSDSLAVLYFAPLLLIAPTLALFDRTQGVVTLDSISLVAAVGTAAAAIVALVDSAVFGEVRAGSLVNNPIHFAALALILGFVALVGISSRRSIVRMAALVAPSLALFAVVLSGSRGPMVAAIPLATLALAFVLSRVSRRHALLALLCLGAIAIIGVLVAWVTGVFRRFTVFVELPQLIGGGLTSDNSASERLQIYMAAWRAFLDSPLVGHGLMNLASPVSQHLPQGAEISYQHLHSDLADFAVAGGALGLAAYFLFLAAPIVETFRRGAWHRRGGAALYLALILVSGFFVMGLTNATFGILSQTTLYAFVTALVVHLSCASAEPMDQTS